MMKRVLVYTADEYLFCKIYLELGDGFECKIAKNDAPFADHLLWDKDSIPKVPQGAEYITISRDDGADIRRPFPIGQIKKRLLSCEEESPIRIDKERRILWMLGEKISLTDIEYALFWALYKRGGAFAKRCELNEEVWGRESDGSLLSVYVHYLREKLERHGEKVIISSRKNGYKIDEKYFGQERGDE